MPRDQNIMQFHAMTIRTRANERGGLFRRDFQYSDFDGDIGQEYTYRGIH